MVASIREAITPDNTMVVDDESTALKLAASLEALCIDMSKFENLPKQVRDKVSVITASMESIRERGINQESVLQLNEVLPGVIGSKQPINAFTKDYSNVNLGYALEELSGAKVGIIAAAITGVIALIVKAIQWVINSIKTYTKKRQDVTRMGLTTVKRGEGVKLSVPEMEKNKDISLIDYLNKNPNTRVRHAAYGYDFLISLIEGHGLNVDGLSESWGLYVDEILYEYNQIEKAFESINSNNYKAPNLEPYKTSRNLHNVYKALPKGVGYSESIGNANFAKQPISELFDLGRRMRNTFGTQTTLSDEAIVNGAIKYGLDMASYNAVNSAMYDRLVGGDFPNKMDKLFKGWKNLITRVNRLAAQGDRPELQGLIDKMNDYTVKINLLNQMYSLLVYIDEQTIKCMKRISDIATACVEYNDR